MAKNKGEQRLRLRITELDGVNENGKSRQSILKHYFKLYEEPELSFGMPVGQGGDAYNPEAPVAILANGEVVGFLDERDRVAFEDNVDRAIRGYIYIEEEDEEAGIYTAQAVIVVDHIVTEAEKRKNEITRLTVIWTAVIGLLIVTVYNLIKGYWMETGLSVILLAFVFYIGVIRKPPKKKSFYQLP